MNIILLAISTTALLGLLLNYKLATAEIALEFREEMTDSVVSALHDPQMSPDGAKAALALFHLSVYPSLVPRFICKALTGSWRQSRESDLSLPEHDYSVLSSLIRQHVLKINFAAAPHWYIAAAILLLMASFFGLTVMKLFRWLGLSWRGRIEQRLVNDFLKMAH